MTRKRKKIRKLIPLLNLIDDFIKDHLGVYFEELKDEYPDEVDEKYKEFADKWFDKLTAEFEEIFNDIFTEKEIDALIEVYRNPIFKRMEELGDKIVERMEEVMKSILEQAPEDIEFIQVIKSPKDVIRNRQ